MEVSLKQYAKSDVNASEHRGIKCSGYGEGRGSEKTGKAEQAKGHSDS